MADVLLPDGKYSFDELKNTVDKDFTSEKEFCDFLETHIRDFCTDFLEVEYSSHIREYKLVKTSRARMRGNRRIDFLIKTKCNQNIVIECKHPVNICELSTALGQCLSYISLLKNFGINSDRTILLSTKIDSITPQVITDFNLPIEFMIMDKTRCVKFLYHGSR